MVALALLLFTARDAEAQHRGLAALPLLNKRYPVRDVYDVIKESKHPAINILYGTFGKKPDNLNRLLELMAADNSGSIERLRVGIYVTCGPCRYPRRDGSLEHLKPRLSISQFNRIIERRNRVIITSFRKRAERILDWSKPWSGFGIEWRIFPELEDNLSHKARQILIRELAKLTADRPEWHIAINPLNPTRIPGMPLEVHNDSPSLAGNLRPGDAVSLDGVDRFPSQRLIDTLDSRHADFLYWDRAMQDPNKPVKDRKFFIRNKNRLKALMRGKVL